MKKNINTIFNFLILIIILFLIYNFLLIIKWEKENRLSNIIFDSIKNSVSIVEKDSLENTIFVNPSNNSSYWYYAGMNILDVNVNKLLTVNNELIGWIRVPGTNIDYPFVHANNNKYYLNHSFDKSYNEAGWIFLDYRNNYKLDNQNNIIYGHARRDGTMFGSLKKTLKKDWFNNKDNHVIKISSPYENSLWQIFSIYYIKTESYYITINFNERDFLKYIDTSINRSIYKFDAVVDTNDTILTLSTCHGETKKLIIQAKLIKKEIKSS